MQNFRFMIPVLAILVYAATMAGTLSPAAAQSLDALRASGSIGERYDGYAVVRKDSPAARKLVGDVNAKRRKIYEDRARVQGVPPIQVGQVYAKQILTQAPKGTWFQDARGGWRQIN